jgi:transposase
MDVGDRTVDVCLLERRTGRVAGRARTPTDRDCVARLLRSLPGRCRVVLETGTHALWIARLVEMAGHEALVADARQIKLIAEGKRKSDRRDAELLARLGSTDGLLVQVVVRDEAVQQHRAQMRLRQGLVETRTSLVNGVRSVVKSQGYRIPTCSVEAFPKTAYKALQPDVRKQVRLQLVMIRMHTRAIRRYDRELELLACECYPLHVRLTQVPSIGVLTALAVLLAMGNDPKRFRSARDFAAFLGLVPGRHQSGGADPQIGITKAGDRYARQLLVGAAHYILNRGPDSDLKRWGLALLERYGPKQRQRAAVAVARKLAVLLHRLLVSGEAYEPLRNSTRTAQAIQPTVAA